MDLDPLLKPYLTLHKSWFYRMVKANLKKSKSLQKKLLVKIRPDVANLFLLQLLSDEIQMKAVFKILTTHSEKFVCPLTKTLIKECAKVYGTHYESGPVKEYIIKYNKTPDNEAVDLQATISNTGSISIVIQPDRSFEAEVAKYVRVKLDNISFILAVQASNVINNQNVLADTIAQLIMHASNLSDFPSVPSLVKALEEYHDLTNTLFQQLLQKWSTHNAIQQINALLKYASIDDCPNFLSAGLSCVAGLYLKANKFTLALEKYAYLYDHDLADIDDWSNLASLLITQFWSMDVIERYPNPAFHRELLKIAKVLCREDVIPAISLALAESTHDNYTKVVLINEVLTLQFENKVARLQLKNDAVSIASSENFKPFWPMLVEVLKAEDDHELLARLYGNLMPLKALECPELIHFVLKVAQSLEFQRSIQYAVDVYNLLADLYFQTKDFTNSALWTEHILDSLDEANHQALARLNEISRSSNIFSLEAKYKLRSTLKELLPGVSNQTLASAVSGTVNLMRQFEKNVRRSNQIEIPEGPNSDAMLCDLTKEFQSMSKNIDGFTLKMQALLKALDQKNYRLS